MKEVFLKHKEFIIGIAILKLVPQKDNIALKEVITAWKKELIQKKSNIVIGDCGNCSNGWVQAIKSVYIYGKTNGWLSENKPVELKEIEITDTKEIIKPKKMGRPKKQ